MMIWEPEKVLQPYKVLSNSLLIHLTQSGTLFYPKYLLVSIKADQSIFSLSRPTLSMVQLTPKLVDLEPSPIYQIFKVKLKGFKISKWFQLTN